MQLIRAIAKVILLFCLLVTCRLALEKGINWSQHQDPRRRLLWDDLSHAPENLFILGDSEFCSCYVNSEQETLWRQLQILTGRRVFAGALNGAESGDFLDEARLLVQERRSLPGGTVIIDIIPTRFLSFSGAEPSDERNYRLADRLATGSLISWKTRLAEMLFLQRIDVSAAFLSRQSYFNNGEHRFRIWNKDGDFARQRYEDFLRSLDKHATLRSYDWLLEIHDILSSGGFKLILVATPLNQQLIEAYTPSDRISTVLALMNKARDGLKRYANQHGIFLVDASSGFSSECFADLLHTNSHGIELTAYQICPFVSADDSHGF